mgnify:CR=1 FL=1
MNSYLEFSVTLFSVFAFIFGACVGSFINVCAWRLPRDESIVSPPSHCPKCNHQLAWFENIPILSWLFLIAKCRKCSQSISPKYIIVETITALLFLFAWLKSLSLNQPAMFFPYCALVFMIVVTILIDTEHMIIPDEITYSVAFAGLFFAVFLPQNWYGEINVFYKFAKFANPLNERLLAFSFSFISLLISALALAIFAIIGKMIFKCEALGWGDVKYIGALGACLGLPACFWTLLAGSVLGTSYGLILIFFKNAKWKTAIPLGPFLSAGTLLWIFLGDRIIQAYIELTLILAR